MSAAALALTPQKVFEDALSYLPRSAVRAFQKGQTIYGPERPSQGVYLVITGTVKICRMVDADRCPVAVDFYRTDDLFGEASLTGTSEAENCVAMENTQVMMWTAAEIERISMERPALALALLQRAIQRSEHYKSRIESFAVDALPRRLVRALLDLSERLGEQAKNDSVEIKGFTHELLSQYVGTSRESVTACMTQFRAWGYLQYSRQGITLDGDALKNWLNEVRQPTTIAGSTS
jgi:CRP/FNR family cyclic AMP-dependent transcriptional regulator